MFAFKILCKSLRDGHERALACESTLFFMDWWNIKRGTCAQVCNDHEHTQANSSVDIQAPVCWAGSDVATGLLSALIQEVEGSHKTFCHKEGHLGGKSHRRINLKNAYTYFALITHV